MFHSATGKIFCGQIKLQLSCLEGTYNGMVEGASWFGATSGPGQLAIIDGKTNSQVYQDILQENVRLSVLQLKLNGSWVMQQDNDQIAEVKQQQNRFNRRKYAFWSGPVRVLSSTQFEMLWHDLKRAVHTRHPKNIAELN